MRSKLLATWSFGVGQLSELEATDRRTHEVHWDYRPEERVNMVGPCFLITQEKAALYEVLRLLALSHSIFH